MQKCEVNEKYKNNAFCNYLLNIISFGYQNIVSVKKVEFFK